MKKIETFVSYDGVERTHLEIEDAYYKSILKYKDPYASLTEVNVIAKMPAGTFLTLEQKILLKLFRIKKKGLALAKPLEMQSLINKINAAPFNVLFYQNDKATAFSKAILEIMNYDGFRVAKTKGIWLAKSLNIKVCPYCNSQYTLVINKGETHKAKFQFDHFFSQSRYPFLCLSLYNLIPSCATCNLSKKEKDVNLTDYVHPYVGSLADEFKYKLKKATEDKFLLGNSRIEIRDIEVGITLTNNRVNNHDNIFDFESIHQRHKDIVQEILYKAKYYPKTRINELLAIEDNDGNKLFSDQSEVLKLLLGNYSLDKDINKRPLAKFMQDIAKQVGLIR